MLNSDNTFSVEPHSVSLTDKSVMWPKPCIVSDVSGKIRIPNTSASPLVLRRNEHFSQVSTTFAPEPSTCSKLTLSPKLSPTKPGSSSVFHSDAVRVAAHEFILSQQELRQKNHIHSEGAKYPSGRFPALPNLCMDDVVYLRCDFNKSKSRGRYLVVEVDPHWCNIRKFACSQLRQNSYRVKYTNCYKVTSDYPEVMTKPTNSHTDTDEDDQNPEDLQSNDLPHSPPLPAVPLQYLKFLHLNHMRR